MTLIEKLRRVWHAVRVENLELELTVEPARKRVLYQVQWLLQSDVAAGRYGLTLRRLVDGYAVCHHEGGCVLLYQRGQLTVYTPGTWEDSVQSWFDEEWPRRYREAQSAKRHV